jgi:hypothetical protein
MAVVVDHLVFDAEPITLAFGVLDVRDPILDTVVALGFEAPFPGQFGSYRALSFLEMRAPVPLWAARWMTPPSWVCQPAAGAPPVRYR